MTRKNKKNISIINFGGFIFSMTQELLLWSAGMVAGFFILNRLIQQLHPRKREKSYEDEISDILNKDEFKVKGKFE